MKKYFFRMCAAILVCSAMTTMFTACGSDDDNNNNNTQTPETQATTAKSASAWFEVNMGADVLEVFDVAVTTICPSFGESTKSLTKTSFSNSDRDVPTKDAGLVFAMGIKVTPKAGFVPDASKTYNLGLGSDFSYYIIDSKNEPLVGSKGANPVYFNELNIPGDKLAERIETLAETWSYDLQKLEVHKTYYVFNGKRVDY